jgi:hypothetical protein
MTRRHREETTMALRKIDPKKLSSALRRLRKQELLDLLHDALKLVPEAEIEALVGGYVDLDKLRLRARMGQLLTEVKDFERSSLAGDYYESFRVNSRNFMDTSEGTELWIDECHRLLDLCRIQAESGDPAEVREAMEIIFGLLQSLDEDPDEIIFFADEAGAWQVGVNWIEVFPAWFRCLSATTEPEEYARRVIEVVDQHDSYDRARHFTAARKAGTPAQAKALGPQRRRKTKST